MSRSPAAGVRVIETLPRGGAKTMNLAELDDEEDDDEGACARVVLCCSEVGQSRECAEAQARERRRCAVSRCAVSLSALTAHSPTHSEPCGAGCIC